MRRRRASALKLGQRQPDLGRWQAVSAALPYQCERARCRAHAPRPRCARVW